MNTPPGLAGSSLILTAALGAVHGEDAVAATPGQGTNDDAATDLGYLYVHPDTGALSFTAAFPTAGRYRLFQDVSLDRQLRTAPFTVDVTP